MARKDLTRPKSGMLLADLRPLALPRGLAWLRAWWVPPLVVGVLALLLRLFRLDAQSLWLDEGGTWQTIQGSWGMLLADLFSTVSAYPLYHVLLKAWVALAGDSEWALRFPSALAGAAAVGVLYFAAREMQPPDGRSRPLAALRALLFPLSAALVLLCSPFALWYAQDAKVYSLLLLVAALLLWALLRALRLNTRQAWLLVGGVALAAVFVHRLAVLLLVAAWAAYLLAGQRPGGQRAAAWHWLLLVLAGGGIVAAMVYGLGDDLADTGAAIPAGPLRALWLTFLRFSLNRGPGEFPLLWLLPWVLLAGWGLALLLHDSLRAPEPRRQRARVLLCLLLVPLALFLAQLAFTHLYQPRYLMLIYPAWLLALVYPAERLRLHAWHRLTPAALRALYGAAYVLLVGAALLASGAALTQPEHGLFSGDPVKEQYREALEVIAERVHPDDAVILHPPYLRPLYDYYMGRLTADPPPEPITFEAFKHRQMLFNQRDWDEARRQKLAGYVRSFLLIAPNHARTVDRPAQADDEYGLVGLYFRYSHEQNKWACGIWRFNGAHVFCQDSPEAYETGEMPQPRTPMQVRFGENIELYGYTLKATTPQGPGVYRAGGTLPVTLFWDVRRQPTADYNIFLHLCRDCDQPPAASVDGPPLEGYLPTSVWLPANPVHDERAIPLPRDVPPGRYTLLLGVYHPADPSESSRLPIEGGRTLPANRLVLGSVEIIAP